jgi:hypothetical protein
MKKVGVLFVAFIVLVGVYYIVLGSSQIVEKMKEGVNKEITTLKEAGFIVKDREVKEKKEHFTIAFDKSDKIVEYLKKENFSVVTEDILPFKGGEFGVDIEYLPRVSDAISMDIYPTKLPKDIYKNLEADDKKVIKSIEKMIEDKVFLIHINIDKLLSSFDGYVKDINRTFADENNISHFISKGFRFDGTLEDEKIKSIKQTLDFISYSLEKQLEIKVSGIKNSITNKGTNFRDIDYRIKSIEVNADVNQSFFFAVNDIFGVFHENIEKGLLSNSSDVNISSIDYHVGVDKTLLKNIQVNTAINNLNESAIVELQNLSSKDLDNNETMKQLIPILKDITTSNSSIDISNISVESITTSGKSFDGLNLNAFGKINSDFNWNQIENNPLALLNLFDTKINLEASDEIVSIISSDPRAMMLMMFIQPIDKNGKKVFNIEFSKGSLKINGRPLI